MHRRFSAWLLLGNLFFSSVCFSNSFTFNRPENTPQANYVLALLKLAYADIGYKIHIIDFNRQNALFAANNGVLDGQLARDISVEDNYKNLIRVDYELFKFNLELYKSCEPSLLLKLSSIAILAGYPVQSRYLKDVEYRGNIVKVKNINTQLNLLTQQKVQGVLLLDFVVANKSVPSPRGCFEKQRLNTYPLYHYLNKSHQHVTAQLQHALTKLHNNGAVLALRAKYGLRF